MAAYDHLTTEPFPELSTKTVFYTSKANSPYAEACPTGAN